MSHMFNDPMDYLLTVMNDATSDPQYRTEAATVLMPYFHESLSNLKDGDADD